MVGDQAGFVADVDVGTCPGLGAVLPNLDPPADVLVLGNGDVLVTGTEDGSIVRLRSRT